MGKPDEVTGTRTVKIHHDVFGKWVWEDNAGRGILSAKVQGLGINMGLVHRRVSSLRWSCEVAVGHDVESEYNGHYMPAKKIAEFYTVGNILIAFDWLI